MMEVQMIVMGMMILIWPGQCITINNGVITDYEGCNVTVNGDVVVELGELLQQQLVFGVVNYNCEADSGIIISKLECVKCGVFCRHNDLIEGCGNHWLPLIIGIMAGVLICLSLVVMCKNHFTNLVDVCLNKCIYHNTIRRDRQEIEAIKVLEKRGIKTTNVDLPQNRILTQHLAEKLEKKRERQLVELDEWKKSNNKNPGMMEHAEISATLTTTSHFPAIRKEAIYEEIKTVENQEIKNEQKFVCKSKSLPSSTLIPVVVVCCILMMTGWTEVKACDQTMWITSEGKICQEDSCKTSVVQFLMLQDHITICFKSEDGPEVKIRHIVTERLIYWNHIYDTAAWNISTASFSRCRGTPECMGYGYCKPNSWHDRLVKTPDGIVHGYGCRGDTVACNFNCGFKTACTWFKWRVHNYGDNYKVYKETYEQVMIEFTLGVVTKRITLSPGNPEITIKLSEEVAIPVRVSSVNFEKERLDNGLIVIDGIGYNTEIAPQNMPNENLIGDLQIDTIGKTYAFNAAKVLCYPQGCRATCNFERSKVQEILNNLQRLRAFHPYSEFNSSIIHTKHEKPSISTISFDGIKLEHLNIKTTMCTINILSTFSCLQCVKPAYILYQASNIKQEGIIHFTSNCTFRKTYLACNTRPNYLDLMVPKKHCQMHIINTNQTLNMSFELNYLGNLDYNSWASNTQADVIGELEGLFTSPSFIQGVLGILSTFSIVSISLTVIFKCIKILELNRIRAEMNKA